MHVIFLNPQGNFDRYDSYLTEHADFGGQLVYMKEVCMAMSKMGVKVDIVTRRIDDAKWTGFSKEIDYYEGYEDNLRIVRISCGGPKFLRKELLWDHLDEFTNNIILFYKDNLPDFATAHYGDGGYCGVMLKTKIGLGFTFTSHSLGAQKIDKLGTTLENFDQTDNYYHFSKRIIAERLSMTHSYKIITSTAQERFEQYSHTLYRGSVDINDDSKFIVIPPGVNTRIFTNKDKEGDEVIYHKIEDKIKGSKTPFIILSSRFEEKKNHLGAVKAYASSKKLQEKANLGIFIRGIDDPYTEVNNLPENEKMILRSILDVIEENRIKDKVFFFNIKSQDELASTYRYFAKSGSVFTLTAFYEPFGLGPIEAAACGLAVVATKNGGTSEIFKDGTGVLIDPSDEENIADGLLKGIVHNKKYSDLGEHRVRSKYTWEKTAEGYLEVIQEGVKMTHDIIPELNAKRRILNYLANKER